jgi:hypothetical protein
MSAFLACFLIGICYLAFGAATVGDPFRLREIMNTLTYDSLPRFLTAVCTIAIGITLLLTFGAFGSGLAGLLSVFGWLALVKGFFLVAMPYSVQHLMQPLAKNNLALSGISLACLIFGSALIIVALLA